ncbi:MAG TPA: APC family permease [Pseudonocardiaceae bacterium]|nr:APC family permease [Pseudonocardiaceae bacterium]
MTTFRLPKRLLVGNPMRSTQLPETLLPKRLALPVYCSDPISSNAYATQEIILVLALGGASAVLLTPWVAVVVVSLLGLVTLSYRQTCHAYPDGGGAYAVSRANLGRNASLVAAAALLVDYVMTVAVSVASGVENFVSAFPALRTHSVELGLLFIAVLMVMNLRGVRESGTLFAIPTYGFILSVFVMLGVGFWHVADGHSPVAESAHLGFVGSNPAGAALVILLLRAFASGCTSLTGVEAVSNGVPTFRTPKAHNAALTLLTMAGLSITMMLGISVLSTVAGVHIAESLNGLTNVPQGYAQRTVLAQLSAAVFGNNTFGFFAVQGFTTLILVLAANTAFNGFPILASILAQDRFLPKQLGRRGDRLVFSNGIVILASIAGVLIVAFNGSVSRLIQLYILGVFVSFTLSQTGMVVYWRRHAAERGWSPRLVGSMLVNAVGAFATAVVLVIVLVVKFTHGAYLVVIAIPVLFFLMTRIHGHYLTVSSQLRPRAAGITLPSRIHAIVLISQLNEPSLKALAFARAIRPSTITALRVDIDPVRTRKLTEEWAARGIQVPLTIVNSPYRDLTEPVIEYLAKIPVGPRDVVEVFVPEYVVGHWWEQVLHNQSALRLKTRLLYMPGVMMTSVPYHLRSAEPYALERPGTGAQAPVPGQGRDVSPPAPSGAQEGVSGDNDGRRERSLASSTT